MKLKRTLSILCFASAMLAIASLVLSIIFFSMNVDGITPFILLLNTVSFSMNAYNFYGMMKSIPPHELITSYRALEIIRDKSVDLHMFKEYMRVSNNEEMIQTWYNNYMSRIAKQEGSNPVVLMLTLDEVHKIREIVLCQETM